MPDAREVLVEALKDVEGAGVPEDLREIAFSKAFDLRAGTGAATPAGVAGPTPGAASTAAGQDRADAGLRAETDELGRIAARVGMDRDAVAEIFTVHEGDVELIVPVGKLPSKTTPATKEIALLIAGGRQAAGIEEFTSWDEIRKVCADFRRLDSGNFAKTMREMGDVFSTRKQSDRKFAVRVAKPGWERFSEMMRRLEAGD